MDVPQVIKKLCSWLYSLYLIVTLQEQVFCKNGFQREQAQGA